MAEKNVRIGVFEKSSNVPPELQGTRIYYSPSLQKFAIVDNDNNTKKFFGFPKYRQFADAGVILFNGDVQDYIEDEYDAWRDEEAARIEERKQAADMEDEADAAVRRPMQQGPTADELEESGRNDPTRHLFGYFFTVGALAVVVIIVRVIVIPLLQNMGVVAIF